MTTMTGILYTSDTMLGHALKKAFAGARVKLYDLSTLGHLSRELDELGPRFILLDTEGFFLEDAKRALLAQSGLPLFCLGQDWGLGTPIPKPINPQELVQKMMSALR
ncbi:MAG: hypothetical protein OXB88_05265 [Bacteriovoracales bacterium]|nr:hypothetical protein [Bacteriovoracales bacterium]